MRLNRQEPAGVRSVCLAQHDAEPRTDRDRAGGAERIDKHPGTDPDDGLPPLRRGDEGIANHLQRPERSGTEAIVRIGDSLVGLLLFVPDRVIPAQQMCRVTGLEGRNRLEGAFARSPVKFCAPLLLTVNTTAI
jgi:hypothetical protein